MYVLRLFQRNLGEEREKVNTSFLGPLSEVLEWTSNGPVSVETEYE